MEVALEKEKETHIMFLLLNKLLIIFNLLIPTLNLFFLPHVP